MGGFGVKERLCYGGYGVVFGVRCVVVCLLLCVLSPVVCVIPYCVCYRLLCV